jgi:hypothetical protein
MRGRHHLPSQVNEAMACAQKSHSGMDFGLCVASKNTSGEAQRIAQ